MNSKVHIEFHLKHGECELSNISEVAPSGFLKCVLLMFLRYWEASIWSGLNIV